jgi:hypothetical protein
MTTNVMPMTHTMRQVRRSTSAALFLIAAGFLLCFTPRQAIAGSGGSIYSLLGIGDIRYVPNVRSAGMGFAGLAVTTTNTINIMSPATWSNIDRVRVEAGAMMEGFNSSDGTHARYLSRADFAGAMVALPVTPSRGITVIAGFTPFSNVNFDIHQSGTFQGSVDTLAYDTHYVGEGGIGKAQLGVSWSPFTSASFGISFDYYFGSINRALTMTPRLSTYAGGSGTEVLQLNGGGASLGGLLNGALLSSDLSALALGGYFSTRASLSTELTTDYQFAASTDTSATKFGGLVIPVSYGIGASYQLNDRLLVAADVATQRWGSAQFNGNAPDQVRDSYRIGAGLEYAGNKNPSAPWASRISLRAGFSQEYTYYRLNGTPIDEWNVTAGVTLPILISPTSDTRISIALQYGRRGLLENNFVRDTVIRALVSVNIGELWFVPYEED